MYGNRAKPFFTDTESLIYEIETEDFYKSISNDVEARLDKPTSLRITLLTFPWAATRLCE